MAKNIEGYLKLQAPAGQATPGPPIGPALGQRGLNIPEFCKNFNDATKNLESGAPTPVIVTIYTDRSFVLTVKKPPVSYYLKKAVQLEKGGATPGRSVHGRITKKQCQKIAQEKDGGFEC